MFLFSCSFLGANKIFNLSLSMTQLQQVVKEANKRFIKFDLKKSHSLGCEIKINKLKHIA